MQMVCHNPAVLCVIAGVFGSAAVASEPQAVVLPPIYTTIGGTLTPVEAASPTFHLSYTGWRSAGPDEQASYYGHTSTSGAQGWADYEFPAWSDAQNPIAEIHDPNIEMIFQTPRFWANLSYLYDPDLDYRLVSVSLAAMVCVDEGCVPTYPGWVGLTEPETLYLMDPAEFREEKVPVGIRGSDPSLGAAGEAMLASFRSQAMSDAEIETAAPNLLEEIAQPVTPTTVVQARYGFWDYTIENDAGVVVTGADLVSFLQSKEAPEEVIYAIINRLPMPPTAQTRGDGDSGHDWRDIKATVRITGSASATTGFPRNQVNGTVEFEVVIEATLGQIESGGQDAVEKVGEIAESASNQILERIEQRINGEDDGDGDDGGDDGPSAVVTAISVRVLTFAIWFVIRETQPLR